MAKSDKKIIRQINKRASIEELKKNTAYRDPKSGRYYITDSKGRFKDFTTEEGAIAYEEKQKHKKEVDKEMKSHFVDLEVKAKKKPLSEKERLKELKNNPEVVREELDKMYDDFLKTKEDAEVEDDGTPEKRILLRKQKRTGQKIYKKATALSNLTGGNEWQEAYETITGPAYESKKDPTRTQDVLESLDTPSETLGVLKRPTGVEELSNEELIKRLKKSK